MANVSTSTQEKALSLLGQGIGPEQVAGACGVSVSQISQLLAQDEFSKKVQEARFENLSKHNDTDNAYDSMEKDLQKQFKEQMQWGLTKPLEVLKAMQVINAMQRRGASAPQHVTNQQTVVPLIMPIAIIHHFSKNSNNQVIKAGDQNLITIQSGQMGALLKEVTDAKEVKEIYHVPNAYPSSTEASREAQ